MPDQMDIIVEKGKDGEVKQADVKLDTAIDQLGRTLSVKLQDYVSKRWDKEREWLDAENLYRGIIPGMDDKKLAAMAMNRNKELPIVNITRPKTNIAIARLQDIQFPTGGDFNFSVAPTPIPELNELTSLNEPMPDAYQQPEMQEVPQNFDPNLPPEAQTAPAPQAPLTIADVAKDTIRKAKDKARRMECKIHDRLVEAQWGKKSRAAMEQMGVLGTAVLKAPVMQRRRIKKYQEEKDSAGDSVFLMSEQYETIPTVQWVDIRMLFPQPSARPGTSIEDIFELHLMTSKEIRDLAKNPAFMKDRVRTVLEQDPDLTHFAKSHVVSVMDKATNTLDDRYSMIEYHGALDKEIAYEMDLISEKEKDDPLVSVQGEIWFCNNTVVRISVAPLEGEEEIPYMFCTWEDDPTSIFGHGIPHLMRHAQRVVASSWLMLLDNAGLTAGPQIVLNKSMIEPANPAEGWQINPMKVWFMTEYGANVQEAMQFVNVPTQQETIANIIEMGMQFADIESSIPAILGGEMPTANNTNFGGMALVMSNSHILQQRHSERWDDNITVPVVEKFYHYEMQYGDDPSVKGDYEVKTGGATERIDKQIKSQDLERIMGMAGNNPEFMEQVDLGEAFREWVATTRVKGILKSREQLEAERQEAAQNPQPDPALIEAQVKERQVAVEEERLKLTAQVEEANADRGNREIVAREKESQVRLQVAQMQRDLELMRMAHENNLSTEEMAAKLGVAQMAEETKRLLKNADLDMFNTEIAVKDKYGEGI